ncbi:HtaA domain-containing protein [Streptomyces sp. NPDC001985]|uniref:HtaA domain-containing protein n=1 Tax=Streptomyces sp. NPDC001985 TaxID=3154406 RepID=UPI003318D545
MSMPRRTRLATVVALAAVSLGSGAVAAPAFAAAPAALAAADAPAAAQAGGSATAASPILATGQVGWAFKTSWFNYVTKMAKGTVTAGDGATQAAGGVIGYPVRHGAVNPAGLDADVLFSGSVTYAAPDHDIIGITLSKPRVVLKDGKGTLTMDVRSELKGEAPVTTTAVPFADLKATAGALDGSRINWKNITATLTAEGAKTFAFEGREMYPAGTALDDAAISGTVTVPTLTVSNVSGLGAETEVTVNGSGYRPGRGVYLAQTVALPGTTYPSKFGNAAYIRKVADDGTFTATLKLTETFTPAGGVATPAIDCRTTACFVASFNSHDGADATWMASRAQDVARSLHFGALKVTGEPADRKVRSGAKATFTATASGADSVQWERSTNKGTTWTAIPGATGTTLSVAATRALNDSRYRAVFTNGAGSVTTTDATLAVTTVPSRITGLNAAPEPVAKGDKVTVTGTLQAVGASDETWRALPKSPLVVEFRAKGAKTWAKAATATSDTKGAFSAKATAAKDGDWRARYTGTTERGWANSGTDYVDVKLRTEVKGFNASPEPVRKGKQLKVNGTLRTLDGTWAGTGSHSVTIWFKANGAKSWSKQATARTNGKGDFWKYFTAKQDGNWKAVFDATSSRLGSSSGSDHVDVR